MIDAVYTWVNFRDPKWREGYTYFSECEVRARRRSDPANSGEVRHTDHGELRYNLRSLERYAPFIRRIHLVVDGMPPDWVRTEAPDIRVVTHRDIFPKGFSLPIFSSDLIESFLWRIPDLSEHYIYFNDDVFLTGQCVPSDFFDADGRSIVGIKPDLIHAKRGQHDRTYNRMLRNTARAIVKRLPLRYKPRFGTQKPWIPLIARRILQGRWPLNMVAHRVQPYRRSVWPLFHETFRREMEMLAGSRFRHEGGFCVNLAHHYLAYSQRMAVFNFDDDDLIVARGPALEDPQAWQKKIRTARMGGLKFLCLNDGVGGSSQEWAQFIDETLREPLGTPSRWERPHDEGLTQSIGSGCAG